MGNERIEGRLDVMRHEAQMLACDVNVPMNVTLLVFARHIAALELAAESADLVVEAQPIGDGSPSPPTQKQFAAFVARLTDSGRLSDDQKVVLAWLKYRAEGGQHG